MTCWQVPWIFFLSHGSDMDLKKLATVKPMGADKKDPTKACFVAKGPGKGPPSKTENF